jgi:hypothetical protein
MASLKSRHSHEERIKYQKNITFPRTLARGVNEPSFDCFVVSFQYKRNGMIKHFHFVSLTKRLTQTQFISWSFLLKRNGWRNGWRNSSVSWSFLSLFRYSFHTCVSLHRFFVYLFPSSRVSLSSSPFRLSFSLPKHWRLALIGRSCGWRNQHPSLWCPTFLQWSYLKARSPRTLDLKLGFRWVMQRTWASDSWCNWGFTLSRLCCDAQVCCDALAPILFRERLLFIVWFCYSGMRAFCFCWQICVIWQMLPWFTLLFWFWYDLVCIPVFDGCLLNW